MYMTLPQPCWSLTGATLWIMSQCHQTESPALTSGMPASGLHEQRVPLLAGREDLVDGDAAHVVVGHVGQQRAQHQVGHRLGDRHGVQDALVVVHVGQRGPALEGAERRAHGAAGVLRAGGAVGGVPGVVLLDGAVEQVPERLLVGLGHPQVEGAGVEVGAQAGGVGARRAAADAVGVERVAVRVEPLHAVGLAASTGCSGTPARRPSGRSAGPASAPVTSRSGRSRAWSRRCRRSRRRGRGSSRRTGSPRRSRRCPGPRPRACSRAKWPRTTRQPRWRSFASASAETAPASMSA